MKRRLTLALLAGAALAAALPPGRVLAAWFDQVKGTGDVATQQRTVGSFTRVVVKGSIDVAVTVGKPQSVAVEAQPNIAEIVETKVDGGALVVSTTKSYSTNKKATVRVAMPALAGVELNGSSNLAVDGARGASLELALSGSGDIRAAGSVDKLTYSCSGSGSADLRKLQAKTADVTISGSGDVKVAAADALTVTISGSGDVVYYGSPRLSQKIRGSGSVSQGH